MGNAFFRYYTLENARAVTLSGQYIIISVGEFVKLKLDKMFKMDYPWVIYQDTDSVVGETVISVNGTKLTIADFYNSIPDNYLKKDDFNQDYVKPVSNCITPSVSSSGILKHKSISYVMKHKVEKELFKITNSRGNSCIVTVDHSIIVKNKKTGEISSISPKKLDTKKHFIISIIDTDSIE